MSASGHPFSSSAALTNVTRLISTGDTLRLNFIIVSCTLTTGTSQAASTENGFAAAVTRNAAGDYTLAFANAFTAYEYCLSVQPIETTDKIYGWVYSIDHNNVRVRFSNEGGTLTDPNSATIVVMGV